MLGDGQPYPRNFETALEAEALARRRGVTPATVGIVKGEVVVGLDHQQIRDMALRSHVCQSTTSKMHAFCTFVVLVSLCSMIVAVFHKQH